jgi:hypothetical protein
MYVRQICVLIHPALSIPFRPQRDQFARGLLIKRVRNRKGTSFYKRICFVVPSLGGGKVICFPHLSSKGHGNSMQTSFTTASPLGITYTAEAWPTTHLEASQSIQRSPFEDRCVASCL